MDNPKNVISFCTGYGGLELGIRRTGVDIRTVCNVEIEAFAQANLVAKIEEGRMDNAPIYSDLKTFPASIFRGKIHGITGGYPCQPFSSAGKRKGEEDPRHLWPYIRKHVRTIRPLWCFFENVRGHVTMGLWRVLSDLEEDGYRTEWGLFSAEETGAPHQRIRCFILAKLPDTCGEGLQGDEFGGTRSPQVEGIQGTHEPTSELHQVRNGQLGDPASLRPRGGCENREGEQSEVLGTGLESDGELAHPASREPWQSQARYGGKILAEEAKKNWSTPTTQEAKNVPYHGKKGERPNDLTLLGQAQKNWRTPRGSMANSPTEKQIKLGAPAKKIEDQVMCEERSGPLAPEKSSTSGKNHGSWPTPNTPSGGPTRGCPQGMNGGKVTER